MARFQGSFSYAVDRGKVRVGNDDQARVVCNAKGDILLIVCDGMGGQNKGDYASKYAVDALSEAFLARTKPIPALSKWWLSRVIKGINREIFSDSEKNPIYKGMGTTLVCALIEGERMTIANVGDSRAYSYFEGRLTRLTEDQTYVGYLYRAGKISEFETKTRSDRHVLMNAIGVFPSSSIDVKVLPYRGETILCCSDGLYNNLSESEIRAIVAGDERAEAKVHSLIGDANAHGGSDNIAIAYWEANR